MEIKPGDQFPLMLPLLLMLLTLLVTLGLVILKEFVSPMECGLTLYQNVIVSACNVL